MYWNPINDYHDRPSTKKMVTNLSKCKKENDAVFMYKYGKQS